MPRSIPSFVLLAVTCLLTASTAAAQSLRTVPVGLGLGHLSHGSGNPPLRLSADRLAIVSEGQTERVGIPDDQIVIVSGLESGTVSTASVGLSSALDAYGPPSRTLVKVDESTFVYYDRGEGNDPQLLVVSIAGSSISTNVVQLKSGDAFDPAAQPVAILGDSTMVWASRGADGSIGTDDDGITVVERLRDGVSESVSHAAGVALGGEVVAISDTRVVARTLGADAVAGTPDDGLLFVDVTKESTTLSIFNLRCGVAPFAAARGPVVFGPDALVYPVVGSPRAGLYVVVGGLATTTAWARFVGDPRDVALAPQPVAISQSQFVYASPGRDHAFRTRDDQICVVTVDRQTSVLRYSPGVGLGVADSTVPPAHLGGARLVFATIGPDQAAGSEDDGVLYADVSPRQVFRLASCGLEPVAVTAVNADSVAVETAFGGFAFFQALETDAPRFSHFSMQVPAPRSFVRINDWTLAGSMPQVPGAIADDVVTVQFPFVEVYGVTQLCGTGRTITIDRSVPPALDAYWPATMRGGVPGAPACLIYSWYAADVPLNPVCRFYLADAWIFDVTILPVDDDGNATVWGYIPWLPWLPGHSFCGQWGTFDPHGYDYLCVSAGFRVHL
jgi:hypothetical protein